MGAVSLLFSAFSFVFVPVKLLMSLIFWFANVGNQWSISIVAQ